MASSSLPLIDIDRLQLGMYVVLDLGWMSHPFLRDRFTLRTAEQLEQLRGLGLRQVRWCPERSLTQPLPEPVKDNTEPALEIPAPQGAEMRIAGAARLLGTEPPTEAQWQAQSLRLVEAEFTDAARAHQDLLKRIATAPQEARESAEQLAAKLCSSVANSPNPSVRLLSQRVAPQPSGHEIGVTALALLLGRSSGFSAEALRELALAALLHDIGKTRLPRFLHDDNGRLTISERRSYRHHVELGVELAQSMALPDPIIQAIAQHHEHADGSGFPAAVTAEQLTPVSRALVIVNRYHDLLKQHPTQLGLTPYQALQQMYSSERAHFDAELLARFIRMLGVYPPGTLVELTDQRMALVVASRPGHALAPRVQIIETPDADPADATIDIDPDGPLHVQRSVNLAQLHPRWMQRARQLARAAVFVEPQTSPEWGAWSTAEAVETAAY